MNFFDLVNISERYIELSQSLHTRESTDYWQSLGT